MCLDGNWQSPDVTVAEEIDLAALPEVAADGFRYRPTHAFRAVSGVPGVVYEMVREADGEAIGSAMLPLSADESCVGHVGHMGCAIRPEQRKQGHTTRIIRALSPVLRARGIGTLLLGSDVGHASHYQSILDAGARLVGEQFGDGSGHCGARFRLDPAADAAS